MPVGARGRLGLGRVGVVSTISGYPPPEDPRGAPERFPLDLRILISRSGRLVLNALYARHATVTRAVRQLRSGRPQNRHSSIPTQAGRGTVESAAHPTQIVPPFLLLPMLLDLLNTYVFTGITGNAAWGVILAWQKLTGKSWEDLYVDSFRRAVTEISPRLRQYADTGTEWGDPVTFDYGALRSLLRTDLAGTAAGPGLEFATEDGFVAALATLMEERQVIVIAGHQLSGADYTQLARNLIRSAHTIFEEAVLSDDEKYRRLMLSETREVRASIKAGLEAVAGLLPNIRRVLVTVEESNARIESGINELLQRVPTLARPDTADPGLNPEVGDVITRELLRRYEPMRKLIDEWRLTDAATQLRAFIPEVDEAAAASTKLSAILSDFRQRVRLALANVLHWNGRREEAMRLWQEARAIGPWSTERALQAGAVLANLGERAELTRLCAQESLVPADRTKLMAILTFMLGNPGEALALIPEETADIDLINLRARARVAVLTEGSVLSAVEALDAAWGLNGGAPEGMISTAELTDHLLRRVINGGWEADGLDRRVLLATIRHRYRESADTTEQLRADFPEAAARLVSSELAFHVFLDEPEETERCRSRLNELAEVSHARAAAELLMDREPPNLDTIQTLVENGYISPAECALLKSRYYADAGEVDRAEEALRSALQGAEDEELRQVVLGELIRLLAATERVLEAEAVLEQERTCPAEFVTLMRSLMALNVLGRPAAITALRSAHIEFPRSRLILQNLVRLMIADTTAEGHGETDAPDRASYTELLAEAQGYAERLVAILPSPEAELQLAILRHRQGAPDAALEILDRIDAAGYRSKRHLWWRAQTLLAAHRVRDAAEVLDRARELYPEDTHLAASCGTAWAIAGYFERSIGVLDPLSRDAGVGTTVLINLAQALRLHAPHDVDAANRAFDLLRQAFERDPAEQTLPARLLQAGHAAGRTEEALALVGSVDLSDNEYLWAMPAEDAMETIREISERLQQMEALYQGGLVPFSVYSRHAPRPAWYLWIARAGAWNRKLSRSQHPAPILVDMPTVAADSDFIELDGTGVLLDMTAIVSLGSLGVLAEVLRGLRASRCPVRVFPGFAEWMLRELHALRTDQLPWYRQRYVQLVGLLERSRASVDIVREWPDGTTIPESLAAALGPPAVDYQCSAAAGAVYVDDYARRRANGIELDAIATSAELLEYFGRQGLVFRTDVERVQKAFPEPFVDEAARRLDSVPATVVLSEQALRAWNEAGLLETWIAGEGWPRLRVGPWAWASLDAHSWEAQLYARALEAAERTSDEINAALDAGNAEECRAPEDEGAEADGIHHGWREGLQVLAAAQEHGLTLCADDLFLRLAVGRFGLLADDPGFRPLEANLRSQHGHVKLMSTADLIRRLANAGAISEDLFLRTSWSMWEQGYRVMRLGGALRWLLREVPYDAGVPPIRYRQLLDDIARIPAYIPPNVGVERRLLFGRVALLAVATELVAEVWSTSADTLADDLRADLAARIVSAYESQVAA